MVIVVGCFREVCDCDVAIQDFVLACYSAFAPASGETRFRFFRALPSLAAERSMQGQSCCIVILIQQLRSAPRLNSSHLARLFHLAAGPSCYESRC